MSSLITVNGFSASALSQVPGVRDVQMDSSGMGNIHNSVNIFRGDINLPLELINIPGKGDLDLKLAIMYQSNVGKVVDVWNMEAPTGILGLGWSLTYDMIVVDNKSGADVYDAEYYLVQDGAANRLYQNGVESEDVWTFETGDYRPWKIRYFCMEERWEIVKENGVTQVFGGLKGKTPQENTSIQWGVKWGGNNGNWIGSTANIQGEDSIAISWNLSEVRNTWGEKLTYEYEQVLVPIGLGGYEYTQACYLSKITALGGQVVHFIYGNKHPYNSQDFLKEYLSPHEDKGQQKLQAWQDRYETKYLDHIDVCRVTKNTSTTSTENLLFSINFEYEIHNVSLYQRTDNNIVKRFLTGITRKNTAGKSLPGHKFIYWLEESDKLNRGALKQIIYPEGGTASFEYEKKSLIGTSREEHITVQGIPRVWFGGSYVVVTSYDDTNTGCLTVKVYSWNGRWLNYEQKFSGKLDIKSLQVVTGSDFFALSFQNGEEVKLYLFHQEMGRFSKWGCEQHFPGSFTGKGKTALAIGENFIALGMPGSSKILLYVWNEQWKRWDEKAMLTGCSGKYVLNGWGNCLIVGILDESGKVWLKLCYQDMVYRDWYQVNLEASPLPVKTDDDGMPWLQWSVSKNFATATFLTATSPEVHYEVRVYQWDAEFKPICALSRQYILPVDTQLPFYYSQAEDSLIGNIGNVWRFDGVAWKENKLAFDSKNQVKFAYGTDLGVVVGSKDQDILAFNPYRDKWENVTLEGTCSKLEYQPTICGNFLTVGDGIFYKNPLGELKKDTYKLPNGVKPDSICNRAPRYLACEIEGGTTQLLWVKNGKISGIDALSERIYVDDESKGQPGTMLAGFNAIVTYTGKNFNNVNSLTLYYVADGAITRYLTDFPVVKVSIEDGQQACCTRYDYDSSRIVLSPDGAVCEYPRATVIHGRDDLKKQPFGRTEYYYYNGLSPEGLGFKDYTEIPPYYYTILHGTIYQKRSYNQEGQEVSRETDEYVVETTRKRMDSKGEINLYGSYIQQIREENIFFCGFLSAENKEHADKTSIKVETAYEYDPVTGLISGKTTTNYNSDGVEEKLTETYTRGWQKYEALKKLNIFTPIVQTIKQNNGKNISMEVCTYKNWGTATTPRFDGYRTYQAKNAEAIFTDWDNTKEPATTEWVKTSEVIARTTSGAIQDSIDIAGVHTSFTYDSSQLYAVARMVNANLQETFYTGFESYETYQEQWDLPVGTDWAKCLTQADAYTGECSFKLLPDGKLQRKEPLKVTSQAYMLAGWIKAEPGFTKDTGRVYISLLFDGAGSTLEIAPEVEGKWQYWQAIIPANQIIGNKMEVELISSKHTTTLFIDNISFVPLAGDFQAMVYELPSMQVVAESQKNSGIMRYVYDSFRRRTADIGLDGNPITVAMSKLKRQGEPEGNLSTGNDFNTILKLKPTEGGCYQQFAHRGDLNNEWKPSRPTAWCLTAQGLVHVGEDTDSIAYIPSGKYPNYGIRVKVQSKQQQGVEVAIRLGEKIQVQWVSGKGWNLQCGEWHEEAACTSAVMPEDWLLSVANRVLFFYADGCQIFSRILSEDLSGTLAFVAKSDAAFEDLILFKNPGLSLAYLDGSNKARQVQIMEGTACLVGQMLYDSLGRAVIQTKIARFDNTLFGYRKGFVKEIDWETGIMQGEVANYYPADEGYPYYRTVYETSLLGRPIAKGVPGREFAIQKDQPHTLRYDYGTNVQGKFYQDSYPTGAYFVEQTTTPDDVFIYTLRDKAGHTLARKTGPLEDGDTFQIIREAYDPAGNLVKAYLPNRNTDKLTNEPGNFEISMEYNFLRQMTTRTTPDSGQEKYIYDLAGRPRFMQDANAAQAGLIIYKKYDRLGRLIEEGSVKGNWDDGKWLTEKAQNDPNWPVQNSWRKRFIFDGDGTNPRLFNQLWKALSSNTGNGEIDVAECYDYDLYGNILEKTLSVKGFDPQTVRYEYNNMGDATKIYYPAAGKITEVTYTYNTARQITGIGTPENPAAFATYRYNADGSLATTRMGENTVPLTRSYEYNSPGWVQRLTNMRDDKATLFTQTLTYTSGGYKGAAYYGGSVAQVEFDFGNLTRKENYGYQYQYDRLGRLKVAKHTKDDQWSLGIDEPLSYDLNGNLLSMQIGKVRNHYTYEQDTDKVLEAKGYDLNTPAFQYDENGNVTTAQYLHISRMTYDPLTNLTAQIEMADSSQNATFRYSADNRRVLKSVAKGSNKLYVHGNNEYPLVEIDSEKVQYIYGPDGLLAMIRGENLYYILKDCQGSVRAVVDKNGSVVTAYDYLPFGNLLGLPYGDARLINYRYTGQEYDPETGLYNYRARLYDPGLGRFYGLDPKSQFASPYVYCGNDPVNLIDPDGELAFLVIIGIAALVGAAIGGGIAAYKGVKAGLTGWKLAGYIAGGALIGAAGGALSAAGGVGAFAAGSAAAAAAGATSTAAVYLAGIGAGALVGAGVGALVGAAQNAAQYELNVAFGVKNDGSLLHNILRGAVAGAIGGAVAGGIAGYGGACAEIAATAWRVPYEKGIESISQAYDVFMTQGQVPIGAWKSYNWVAKVLAWLTTTSKFSSAFSAGAQAGTDWLMTGSEEGSSPVPGGQSGFSYSQMTLNPAMAGNSGMMLSLATQSPQWSGTPIPNRWQN